MHNGSALHVDAIPSARSYKNVSSFTASSSASLFLIPSQKHTTLDLDAKVFPVLNNFKSHRPIARPVFVLLLLLGESLWPRRVATILEVSRRKSSIGTEIRGSRLEKHLHSSLDKGRTVVQVSLR